MRIPTIVVPGGRPRHVKQLQSGSPTAEYDCGPASILVGLSRASHSEWMPHTAQQRYWIGVLRNQMYRTTSWPATTFDNHEQAVESNEVRKKFRESFDLKQPTLRLLIRGTHQSIISNLRAGRAVTVAVDYGAVRRNTPRLWATDNFTGGHAITLVGWGKAKDGTAWTWLYDSLFDGRRDGIPKGPQPIRIMRYLQSAEPFGNPPAGQFHAYFSVYSNPARR